MKIKSLMRVALTTTAIALAIPAYAADSQIIDYLNRNNQEITTDNLNQAMLGMTQGGSSGSSEGSNETSKQCDPTKPGLSDDPTTEVNECELANLAPAAGDDDGGEEAEPEEEVQHPDDELSDPEPPVEEPPVVDEEPPQEEDPKDEETPCEEYPGSTPVDYYPGSPSYDPIVEDIQLPDESEETCPTEQVNNA